MEDRAFGALTRQVAAAKTRRNVLRRLGAGIAATVLHTTREAPVAAAGVMADAFGFCTVAGFPCKHKTRCCAGGVGGCKDGVCGCARKGKSCLNRTGLNCCSRKCRKGKCL